MHILRPLHDFQYILRERDFLRFFFYDQLFLEKHVTFRVVSRKWIDPALYSTTIFQQVYHLSLDLSAKISEILYTLYILSQLLDIILWIYAGVLSVFTFLGLHVSDEKCELQTSIQEMEKSCFVFCSDISMKSRIT